MSELARAIKAHALALREQGGAEIAASLPGWRPDVVLPLDRPLYRPTARAQVDSHIAQAEGEADLSAVFSQFTVDIARLTDNVRERLGERGQVELADVVADRPIEQGLAELVAYLALSDRDFVTTFNDESRQQIALGADRSREADVPGVTFVRRGQATRGT